MSGPLNYQNTDWAAANPRSVAAALRGEDVAREELFQSFKQA